MEEKDKVRRFFFGYKVVEYELAASRDLKKRLEKKREE